MAYTVLDSKNINKTKNIYTFGGSGTKPEREDIAENSKLIDYSSGQKFYYDPSKAAGSKWQPDKEPSGGSSGEGLPADFPAEGSENANKFLGFDANGDYTAKDAPSGGAEKFVVTLTQENDTWTADKTVAEIVAAKEAGKIVVAKYPFDAILIDIPCVFAGEIDEGDDGTAFTMFYGPLRIDPDNFEFVHIGAYHDKESESDFWEVAQVDLPSLPDGSNNGDVLVWDDDHDKWKAESNPNAPLIVTMTAGATEGQLVGDKTFGEVYAAMNSGITVSCVGEISGSTFALPVLSITNTGGGSCSAFLCLGGNLTECSGASSEYFTTTVG